MRWIVPVSLAFSATVAAAQLRAPMEPIDALIGAADCTDVGQCRVIGIGSRSCGGPDSYRAWSTLVTDEQALVAAVAKHAADVERINQQTGRMSTCVIVPEPAVSCLRSPGASRGTCVLQTQPRSGGARDVR